MKKKVTPPERLKNSKKPRKMKSLESDNNKLEQSSFNQTGKESERRAKQEAGREEKAKRAKEKEEKSQKKLKEKIFLFSFFCSLLKNHIKKLQIEDLTDQNRQQTLLSNVKNDINNKV